MYVRRACRRLIDSSWYIVETLFSFTSLSIYIYIYLYLGLPAGHKLLMSHSVFNFSGGPLRIDKNLENRQFLEFGDFYGFMFSEQPSGS